MSIPFRDAPFKTSSGTTALTLDERFSQIINVAEFADLHEDGGTFGSGSGNDAPCFQAAFDLAFGPASAPHGEDNKHLNRPVYIPHGKYKIDDTLHLTRVVGGLIYGAGRGPTEFRWGVEPAGGATLTPMININGAVGLTLKNMEFRHGGGGGTYTGLNNVVLNIDWDGVSGEATAGNTGGGGLRFNHFESLQIGAGEYGVIVGRAAGSEGHNQMFVDCVINGSATSMGMDIRGPDATVSMIGGAATNCALGGVRCSTGGGSFFGQALCPTGNLPDFIMESDKMMHIAQMRSESYAFLRMENGLVHAQAIQWAGYGRILGTWSSGTEYESRYAVARLGTNYQSKIDNNINHPPESSPTEWGPYVPQVEVNGGKFIYETSQLSSSLGGARIGGTGGEVHAMLLYNGSPWDTNTFEDYSGTIATEFGH